MNSPFSTSTPTSPFSSPERTDEQQPSLWVQEYSNIVDTQFRLQECLAAVRSRIAEIERRQRNQQVTTKQLGETHLRLGSLHRQLTPLATTIARRGYQLLGPQFTDRVRDPEFRIQLRQEYQQLSVELSRCIAFAQYTLEQLPED